MQLAAKKGVRYTGGSYDFIVKIKKGSLDEVDVARGMSAVAQSVVCMDYLITQCEEKGVFQLARYSSHLEKQDFLKHGYVNLAKMVFRKTICPRMFELRIKCAKNLERKDYNDIDRIVYHLFGSFERKRDYGPEEESIRRESQPRHHEQLNLFQPG